MGIYIKGMEMPDNCRVCPLETDYGTCGYYSLYVEAGHESDYEKRRDDCPLVPVQPHGRLIDADALIEKVIAKYLAHERKGELVFATAEIKQDIVDLISDAPTIIPAEEDE